jgi:hypothetical protein
MSMPVMQAGANQKQTNIHPAPNLIKTMKTIRHTLASLTTAAVVLAAGTAEAANRTLILLQENSGRSSLTDFLPDYIQAQADAIVDTFVETSESANFQSLASGSYQRFINLSDTNCTRARLLSTLITQSVDGYTVDLAVLGHGSSERLVLNSGSLTGGLTGNLRSMLTEARAQRGAAFNFKLRAVHMCNCFGSTLNDDWLAIGAQVSVGSRRNNYMPEPMLSYFWNGFVKSDKRVSQASSDSYSSSVPLWSVVPGYNTIDPLSGMTKIQESLPIVAGNGNLIFKDEMQLRLNESRTFTVQANRTHTFPGIYLCAGQTYTYSATGTWRNGNTIFAPAATNANGYVPGILDAARRHSSNMMCLVGERFNKSGDPLSFVGGSGFRIGASNTLAASGHGFLNLYANDMLTAYGDNIGSVTVTIRRVQ